MKMRFDTSTTAGKIAVMEEYERNPSEILLREQPNIGSLGWFSLNKHGGSPNWNWEMWDHNYPAEPKLVPWTLATVPNKVPEEKA